MRLAALATLAILAVPPDPVDAQLRTGTLLEDGRVVVKIFVTMPDSMLSAGQPIPNVRLLLSNPTNRYTVPTDGAGTATTFALPGAYRVATLDSVEWQGRRYHWDLPIDVRPGMSVIDLTPANAASAEPVSIAAARREDLAPMPSQTSGARQRAVVSRKDAGIAQLLSFLITGSGQMYAGEAAKGLALLLSGATAGAIAINSADCDAVYGCGDDDRAITALFAVAAISIWVYGIADADNAVERWNTRHGLSARSGPVIGVDDRRLLLGASLSF